ncbi:MAG: DUF2683 family protein [Bacteroidota bacterium]
MELLVVYPKNKKQLTALKAVMKAMKIDFVEQNEVVKLPAHVIGDVNRSIAEADAGDLRPYTGIKDMLDQA